jgi:SAM-dependent methyltransferase
LILRQPGKAKMEAGFSASRPAPRLRECFTLKMACGRKGRMGSLSAVRLFSKVKNNLVPTKPSQLPDFKECYFYHTMDVPGQGLINGDWDLRNNMGAYLGNVDFKGKRVLDVGTASGCLAFHMEKLGADVVGYDLDKTFPMDVAPSRYGYQRHSSDHEKYIDAVNKGFWFAHIALGSKATMRYGTVYQMPADIGSVDISVFGSILLHLRDPFLALKNAIRLTKEKCIVAEPIWQPRQRWIMDLVSRFIGPYQIFAPDYSSSVPQATWWLLTPAIVQKYLAALGFEKSVVTYHEQLFRGTKYPLFTIVAERTQPQEDWGLG